MLISAVLVPLLLLVMVLAPSWYAKWKVYSRQTALPLPAPARPVRTRLARVVARTLLLPAAAADRYQWIHALRDAWNSALGHLLRLGRLLRR